MCRSIIVAVGVVLLSAVLVGFGVSMSTTAHAQAGVEQLSVSDFSFDGPLGSAGAEIEELGRNHFKVTLDQAPGHTNWPNKLNFEITQNARGNDLLLEVAFNGGSGMSFNEYFQSWSYDGVNWQPIQWERGFRESPQRDVLVFPTFTKDRVYVGTQVPMSYEDMEGLMEEWQESPHLAIDTIGQSLGGRNLYRIEITDADSPHPRTDRWVHYFANQHPGEHNSQWRMVGMIEWLLSEEAADFRERSVSHFVLMMSPDAPSKGWYRVNAEGVDMNRSYRPDGADRDEQAHEAYLWQKDLEALMASDAPVTTIWAMHTWQGLVEPLIRPGPEMENEQQGDWTTFKQIIQENDRQGLIKPLDTRTGDPSYGSISWASGPHKQFGITAVLCEGGGNLFTEQENRDTGVVLLKSIAEFYRGTR